MLGFRPPVSALTAAQIEDYTIPFLAETLFTSLPLLNSGREVKSDASACMSVTRVAAPPAPINQLPLEIIGEIFLWCVDLDDNIYLRQRRDFVSSLSVITGVCVLWRVIALSMPELWSKIFIFSPRPRHLVMTKLFLERSKSHPLTLRVECNDNQTGPSWESMLARHPDEYHFTECIIHLLSTHLYRWRKITLSVQRQPSLLSLNLTAETAPLLQEATLRPAMWDKKSAHNLCRIFSSCPSIRQLSWPYLPPLIDFALWRKLTVLRVRFNSAQSCLEVLQHCHSLRDLDISIFPDKTLPIVQHITAITLSELISLVIHTRHSLTTIFNCLTLPVLRSVCMNRYHESVDDSDALSFLRVLKRSSCQLEKFGILDHKTPHTDELYTYLKSPQFASLTELEVHGGEAANVVDLLTCHQNRPCMLPKLHKLVMNVNVPDELVLRLFASRIDYSPNQCRDFQLLH